MFGIYRMWAAEEIVDTYTLTWQQKSREQNPERWARLGSLGGNKKSVYQCCPDPALILTKLSCLSSCSLTRFYSRTRLRHKYLEPLWGCCQIFPVWAFLVAGQTKTNTKQASQASVSAKIIPHQRHCSCHQHVARVTRQRKHRPGRRTAEQ